MPVHRRTLIRRTVLIVCAIGVTALLVRHGLSPFRELRTRLHMRELQGQCAAYNPPPDLIVYDDDPLAFDDLRRSDPQLVPARFSQQRNARLHVMRQVESWSRYSNLPDGKLLTPLFLHGRRCGANGQRLAAVLLSHREEDGGCPSLGVVSFTLKPVTPWSYPEMQMRASIFRVATLPNAAPIRFYAGQFDPHDATLLTIAFEAGGTKGTLAGQVLDDGTVRLWVASGPGEIVAPPRPQAPATAPR